MDMTEKQRVMRSNYEAFAAMLPRLLPANAGKYALLREGKVVAFFGLITEAVDQGEEMFDDGLFSVQRVTSEVVDLGLFSHAGYQRDA